MYSEESALHEAGEALLTATRGSLVRIIVTLQIWRRLLQKSLGSFIKAFEAQGVRVEIVYGRESDGPVISDQAYRDFASGTLKVWRYKGDKLDLVVDGRAISIAERNATENSSHFPNMSEAVLLSHPDLRRILEAARSGVGTNLLVIPGDRSVLGPCCSPPCAFGDVGWKGLNRGSTEQTDGVLVPVGGKKRRNLLIQNVGSAESMLSKNLIYY